MKKNSLIQRYLPKKRYKIPLKRSLTGYEIEMFVVDSEGRLDHSDQLRIKAKQKQIPVEKECAKAMIELGCLPARRLRTSSQSLTNNLMQLLEVAEASGNMLFPFATYFGKNNPIFRKKQWYTIQKKILGEKAFRNAGLCCGFHQHYTLPRGMYDSKKQFINYRASSKLNKVTIDSYNLLTAMDPVLSTLTQSSPYINNSLFAKDSRVILYRGGKLLKCKDSLYNKYKIYGALTPYKATLRDLMATLRRRHQKWRELMIKEGFDHTQYVKTNNILHFTWNPVKVNRHGTFEYRGSDMNFLSVLFGVSTMFQFALKRVQQDYLIVAPLDTNINEAFKVESNVVFIPPFSEVVKLQAKAAYEGLHNEDVYAYTKSCFQFIKNMKHGHIPLLDKIKKMIDEKRTTSDKIESYFKRKGYVEQIPESVAQQAALKFSADFSKDLSRTSQILETLDN